METQTKKRLNVFSAIFYFFDVFIFEEILIPMFKTITFQRFWRKSEKTVKLGIIKGTGLFFWQIVLFFGSIPFLMFLLGQDNVWGLVCSGIVLLYIMYTITVRNKATDPDYQKSVVFLMIPLYYVCMVELFRWSFLFSPEAAKLVPDRSDFLFLGIQNFIRTQLFLDLFDTIRVVNLEVSGYLFLGATFITRLLLDIAVISLLIQAGIKSYRRTWIYYYSGEQVSDITEKETLFKLENIATVGNPKEIEKASQHIPKVLRVLNLTKQYAQKTLRSDNPEHQEKAQECLNYVAEIPSKSYSSIEYSNQTSFSKRFFSLVFILLWGAGFIFGIRFFIDQIIRIEIQDLMTKAASENYENDPIGKQILYDRVLEKDANYYEAMIKSAENYIQLAELNERVFSYEQALIDIDEAFQNLIALDNSPAKEKYASNLIEFSGQAYAIRGRLFFLQGDIERALAELRKRKTTETKRMLFDIELYRASQELFSTQANDYLVSAINELGFDPNYDFTFIHTLLRALHASYNKDQSFFIADINSVVKQNPQEFADLKNVFSYALAQALVREGKSNFADAENLYNNVYNATDSFVGTEKYSALLGLANLHRLNGKFKEAMATLNLLENDQNTPSEEKNLANLATMTLYLQQNKRPEAARYLKKLIDKYDDIRDVYKGMLENFILGKVSNDQLLDEAQNWDIAVSEKQHALCYYYIGTMYYVQKKYDQAALFWQRSVYMNINVPETRQAKQELENLQILLEGKSYQSQLFFDSNYLNYLNTLLRKKITSKINPQQKTVDALTFLLTTEYEKEKINALVSVAARTQIADEKFLLLLQETLSSTNKDLQLAALTNLSKLDKDSISQLKDTLVAQLSSPYEQVRRLSLVVLNKLEDVDVLITALTNEDKFIRRDSGYALAKIKEKATPAADAIANALYDTEIMVRDAAFASVIYIDKEKSAPVLTELVKKQNHDSELRIKALQELAANHQSVYFSLKEEITPILLDLLLNSRDDQSSRWSALQLIRIKADDTVINDPYTKEAMVRRLTELMESSDLQTRASTAGWYLNLSKQDATPAIQVFMDRWSIGDKNDQINVAGSYLLNPDRVSLGSILVLEKAFEHENPKIRSLAQELYYAYVIPSNYGSEVTKGIVASLVNIIKKENEHSEIAQEILGSYKNDNPEVVVPQMLSFLADENEKVRFIILNALQLESRDYTATDADSKLLVSMLGKAPETVLQVAQAFSVKDPQMYSSCVAFLDSEKAEVAASAIRILANFPEHKKKHQAKLLEILNQKFVDPFADPGSDEFADDSSNDEFADDEFADDSSNDEFADDEFADDSSNDEFADDSSNDEFADDSSGDNSFLKVEAALYTLSVWNGLDYLYNVAVQKPHLVVTAMSTCYGVQDHLGLDDADVMKFLGKFLSSDNEDTVLEALFAIDSNQEGKEHVLTELKKLQKSSSPDIRKLAQKIILSINPTKDIALLKAWLFDGDEQIELAALDTIAKLKITETELISKIAQKLTSSSEEIQYKTVEVLVTIGEPAVSYLQNYTKHNSANIQILALNTLGKIGLAAEKALPDMMKMVLTSKNENVQFAAISAASNVVTQKHRGNILGICKQIITSREMKPQVKIIAWTLVAKVGEKERALNSLIQMLSSPTYQELVIQNLQKIDTDYTIQYLKQVIRNRYGSISVITAINILGSLEQQGKTAIPLLNEMVLDPNPEFSSAAKNALARIK